MPKDTKYYLHHFIPKSRRELDSPVKEDTTIVPDSEIIRAYNNQLGHFIGITARLYLGGIIEYRLDSPCIEVHHERPSGITRIAQALDFKKYMRKD